jgi:CRISPR-associated protein Csx10
MRTSVGSSGSARPGFLFSQEELPAGSQFRGYIYGRQNELERLMEQLDIAFQETLTGFIGRRHSGKCELKLSNAPTLVETPHIFPWSNESGEWVTLTLSSDSILVDRLLRPVTGLKRRDNLVAFLDFPPQVKVEVKKAFAESRTISGWSGVGEMFRPDDLALVAGSTFLLHFEDGASQLVRDWAEKLYEEGIGLRRAEGFGRVTFSHPVHVRSVENQHGSRAQ